MMRLSYGSMTLSADSIAEMMTLAEKAGEIIRTARASIGESAPAAAPAAPGTLKSTEETALEAQWAEITAARYGRPVRFRMTAEQKTRGLSRLAALREAVNGGGDETEQRGDLPEFDPDDVCAD